MFQPRANVPPDLAWKALLDAMPWRAAMADCVQDPVFHAEGDVLTHTRMVCEALDMDPMTSGLAHENRRALLVAAALHDVKKPETRVLEWSEEDGRERVRHPNHAIKGARAAHAYLYRMGVDAATRERVFAAVAWHQRVFRVMERDDPGAEVVRYSQLGPVLDLTLLADADNRGRVAPDQDETSLSLEMTRMLADEAGCLTEPYPFDNDEARVLFGRDPDKGYHYVPPAARGARVVVLSGLPGSGKDTYAKRRLGHLPQVSLDDVREALGIDPRRNQGRVVQAAFEAARLHLRSRQAFVWNATTINRRVRDQVVDFCLAYDAHVSIHVMDTPWARVVSQNRERRDCVPTDVLEDKLEDWEPPSPLEAHEVWRVSPSHELTKAYGPVATGAPTPWFR